MTVIVILLMLSAVGYLVVIEVAPFSKGFSLAALWDGVLQGLRPQRRVRRIASRAMSAITRDVIVGVRGDVLVQDRIRVQLSADDHDALAPIAAWFCADVGSALEADARKRGWKLNGPIQVTIEPSSIVPNGRPHVLTAFSSPVARTVIDPGTPHRAAGQATEVAVAVLSVGDHHTPISRGAAVTVGRGDDCDIVVDDPMVSTHHLTVSCPDGTLVVADTGSSNGTWVNDQRVQRARLGDGDVIRAGQTRINLRCSGSEARAGGLQTTQQLA